MKADPRLRDIPVIVISALDEMDSVVKGIELGAEDYLPKTFDPVLLRARIGACLEKKRFRDQEIEYLRQVERLTAAAAAVEAESFDPDSLAEVSTRPDALGQLARVFQHMAHEVHAREQRLLHQIRQLQLDTEERHKATLEIAAVYLPMDRRLALTQGQTLPTQTHGAALFAVISGFTPLTAALTHELGLQRGAEELTRQLNRVYSILIAEIHRYGGSVLAFSGDAITCWFDDTFKPETALNTGQRAAASALAMQSALDQLETMTTPAGTPITLAIKIALTGGPAARFLVGDAAIEYIDTLTGQPLDDLVSAEHLAQRGEIVIDPAIAEALGQPATLNGWRTDPETHRRFAVITGLSTSLPPCPWPDMPQALTVEQTRPWLLAPIFERVQSGQGFYLAELRVVTTLFLQFGGLDFNRVEEAELKLNAFIQWVQRVLARFDGYLLQLTIGDKGSYLYASFGAPVALENDAEQAVLAAQALQSLPPELNFINQLNLGLARGQMRAGSYGSPHRRTYGVLGDKTNLAARLMQEADNDILCDESVFQAASAHLSFEPLPPLTVKGKSEPIPIYRPHPAQSPAYYRRLIDQLPPTPQLSLKIASLLGNLFQLELLQAVFPDDTSPAQLLDSLAHLVKLDLIAPHAGEPKPVYRFTHPLIQETAYQLMLFGQRRQLHRAAALWYEQNYADALPYATLAHHWQQAENPTRAIFYLEKAGEWARRSGSAQQALEFYNQALTLEAQAAVLGSADQP